MRPLSISVLIAVSAGAVVVSAAVPAAAVPAALPAATSRVAIHAPSLVADFDAGRTPSVKKAPDTLGAGYLSIAGKNHASLTHFTVPSACSGDASYADSDLGTTGFRADGSFGETALVDTVCNNGVPTSSLVAIDWTQHALNSATAKAGDHVTTYVNETSDQTFVEVDDQTDGSVAYLDDDPLSSIDSQFLTGSLNNDDNGGSEQELSDFGKVVFSGTLLDGVDVSNKSVNGINQRTSGVTQAVAGSLNVKQDTFTVTWKAAH
jgi:hypothetical protein